jgi:hypothetical protein
MKGSTGTAGSITRTGELARNRAEVLKIAAEYRSERGLLCWRCQKEKKAGTRTKLGSGYKFVCYDCEPKPEGYVDPKAERRARALIAAAERAERERRKEQERAAREVAAARRQARLALVARLKAELRAWMATPEGQKAIRMAAKANRVKKSAKARERYQERAKRAGRKTALMRQEELVREAESQGYPEDLWPEGTGPE